MVRPAARAGRGSGRPGAGGLSRPDLPRRLRRVFEPAYVTRDRRDNEHLHAILGAVLRRDSNCVDVGAHSGAVLSEILRLAPDGGHVAFEPLPQYAAELARAFPAVDVRRAAVSDVAGETDFVEMVDDPGWSGFRERPTPAGGPSRRLRVATVPLDAALPPDRPLAFVKIDVEGAEELVLRGAAETLRRHRPLVAFEHGLGSADHYGTRPATVHELLSGCGLDVFDLDGGGPYDVAAFTRAFDARERVNWLARPWA